MAWTDPVDPVTNTVITVAYAVANFLTQIRWLRVMTGNADPPASNRVVVSSSTSATAWAQVPTDAIADSAVTNSKLGASAVTSAKIQDGSIHGQTDMQPSTITGNSSGSAIGTGVIHPNRLVPDAFDSSQVAAAFGDNSFDATNVGALFATDSFSVANVADIVQDASILYPHAASSFFLAPAEKEPSADYSLTASFADVTGCTVTTTRAGTYLVFIHVAFTTSGILTTGAQFQARVQRTGSGTANSRAIPSVRTAGGSAAWDIVSAVVVMTAPSSGDVFHLQALDSQASNSVEQDYTWIVPVWIAQ